MCVSMFGTVPKVVAEVAPYVFLMHPVVTLVSRTVTVIAIGTVPIAGSTRFGVRMPGFIAAATPAVFTGCIFGVTLPVAAVAIDAPPVMFTIFGFLISLHALLTEPAFAQAGVIFKRRMVRIWANGACPVMRTAFGRT